MNQGPCEYCTSHTNMIQFGEGTGEDSNLYVCGRCLKLLRNPTTALPLIRGHLTMKLRGIIPEKTLKDMMDTYMSRLSTMKSSIKN